MLTIHPQYILDHEGNKISVVLPIQEYECLIEELEVIEDIRLYDEAKSTDDPSFPVEEAFKMIERERNNK